MPVDIKVPMVGESVTEGTIARWLKKDGTQVQLDEPIFELESEKATQEVPAPAAGVLHIKVDEGQKVAIGAVVGLIETGAAAAAPAKAPERDATAEQKPAPTAPAKTAKVADTVLAPRPAPLAPAPSDSSTLVASHAGLTPRRSPLDTPAPTDGNSLAPQSETRQRMSAIRQRIAERLLAAQKQTASLTTFNEADMEAIMALRTRYKEVFKEKYDVGLGFMSFFVKAAVLALKAYPVVNARIDEADIVMHHYYNIGVAVSTEKGLMVPVLKDADKMSFAEIEKAIAAMADKAREGKINVADLQGGTFTITNGGIFGSMLSTPILNPPQSAILGMHAIQKRPVVRDDQIVIRPMMYLALTYDHRLIDGREAVLFLVRLKECLENPERLLLDL
jgi:2-oxoglutarate dehydrogenase E2 component (dihydrolipoamide succinyltransferase)